MKYVEYTHYAKQQTIKKDSDISHIEYLDWDVVVKDQRYDVYRITNFIHTIGSTHGGANDLWCCEEGEIPTFENLIGFNGRSVQWGIEISEGGYLKNKYDSLSLEKTCSYVITRNGEVFYSDRAISIDVAYIFAKEKLLRLQEHPIDFTSKKWKEELNERKIWWRNDPAIIRRLTNEGSLIVIPDGIKEFSRPAKELAKTDYDLNGKQVTNVREVSDMYWEESKTCVKTDLFDSNIDWWRK